MYNYNHTVHYTHIKDDTSDTKYRKDFLTVFNSSEYDDNIIDKQDNILNKFKNNAKFIYILEKGKTHGFNNPFAKCAYERVLCYLFCYDYFESFHLCLQDLFKTNDISDANFTKITNLLS